MTTTQIVWTVVIVVVVLALAGVLVASMRKRKRAENTARAQELREQADTGAAGLPDAQARAEQAEARAESARAEAALAEEEAERVRVDVDRQQARHEDQIRAADRLDPSVDHRADDYVPAAAAPAGPSDIPADPAYADPDTGRATPGRSATPSRADDGGPDTILDADDTDPTSTGGSHRA